MILLLLLLIGLVVPRVALALDYRIEVMSGTSMTVTQGFASRNAVHVALLSGPKADVTLSVTGLPTGATAAWEPSNLCKFDAELGAPPNQSTFGLKINTTASTPLGTHPIQITGSGSGVNRQTALSLIVEAVPSATATYYVAESGSDVNSGTTPGSPFRTIQKAADVVPVGGLVIVEPGLYQERVQVKRSGTSGQPIRFLGKDGAILDGGTPAGTGWTSSSGVYSGSYRKLISSIGFEPLYMSWDNKFILTWQVWPSGDFRRNQMESELAADATGVPYTWAGGYGVAQGGYFYIKLRNNANPNTQTITLSPLGASFEVNGYCYNVLQGFTVRHGFRNVQLHNGACNNTIRHNAIRGGAYGIEMNSGATGNVVEFNDITLDHYYNDVGHSLDRDLYYPADTISRPLFIHLRHGMQWVLKHHGINVENSSNITIRNNHIYKNGDGVGINYNIDGFVKIGGNYLWNNAVYSIYSYVDQTGLNTFEIYDNLIYEGTDNVRLDGMPRSAALYIYKNRIKSLSSVNATDVILAEPQNMPDTIYIYHNTFAGTRAVRYADDPQSPVSKTGVYVVNNVMSAENNLLLEGGWVGSGLHASRNWIGPGGGGYSSYGSGNVMSSTRMFDAWNPSFLLTEGSAAIGIGVNVAQAWSVDGSPSQPALPGMTQAYYASTSPDAGTFQFTTAASTPTYSAAIKIDQFGYRTTDQKIAVLSDPQTGFNATDSYTPGATLEIRRWVDDSLVSSGTPTAWNGGATHTQSGDKVWHFDFSSITTPGEYYVNDPTNNFYSGKVIVADTVYQDVLKQAVRMFYYQRSGMAKAAPYTAAKWADGAAFLGTLQDTQCRLITDPTNASLQKSLEGGWFDAGDYNKYTVFAVNALTNLLHAYEDAPTVWGDDYGIPESGNGIPDLLDEVKWELDWLLKMQAATGNGSVLSKVSVSAFQFTSPPSADTNQRFYGIASTSSTAAAAAVFAHASKIFTSIGQTAYGTTLATAAANAWTWANSNPSVDYANTGFSSANPEPNGWGPSYGRLMKRLQAAVYLYALTGSATYKTFVEANYTSAQPIMWDFWYAFEQQMVQNALLYYSKQAGITSSVKTDIESSKIASIAGSEFYAGFTGATDAYRAYLTDANHSWGSNQTRSETGNVFLDMVRYNLDSSNHTGYRNAASGYLHYLHGVNPLGLVYLTNLSDAEIYRTSANEMWHAWFYDGTAWDNALTSPKGPAPGYLTGGPNAGYTGNLSPPLGQPPQKAYLDTNAIATDNKTFELNEPAIYYQAAYIRLLAAFVPAAETPETPQPPQNLVAFPRSTGLFWSR